MWVKTQDGKTTINVDRFTIIENSYELIGEEIYEEIFRYMADADYFVDKTKNISLINKYMQAANMKFPFTHYVVSFNLKENKTNYAIVCGDVILGTYPTLERAEYVRKNHLERYLLDADRVIVDLSKETDVTDNA